jgi:hypothetical protein
MNGRELLKTAAEFGISAAGMNGCIRKVVQPNDLMNNQHESTYALLVRSEEKSRSFLETILYALFLFSAVASIWQFAHQPVTVPARGLQPPPCVACHSAVDKHSARS